MELAVIAAVALVVVAPGHCVTTDDAGHAFVCDPRGGRLLVDDDRFDPITR